MKILTIGFTNKKGGRHRAAAEPSTSDPFGGRETMSKFVIQPHFRLQEWVADEKGSRPKASTTSERIPWSVGVCARPELADRGIEKGSRQSEKDHSVQRLQSPHEPPVFRQIKRFMPIGRHGAQRVQQCGLSIG
jgi:hypothetical protein